MKILLFNYPVRLFWDWSAKAQVVYIADSAFKAYLLADTAINTNLDTSIQVSKR